jgi:ATP-binding cassette subfamily B protein
MTTPRGEHDVIPKASMRRRARTLLRLLARTDRRFLVAMAVLITLLTVAGAAQSLALKWMVNGAIERRWTFATTAAVIGGLAAGVLGAAGRVYENLQDWIAARVGVAINRDTVTAAATMPGLEHLERPEYLDQLTLVNDGAGNLVRSVFAVTDLVSLGARIAIGVWLLATVDPILVLVPLFAVPSVLLSPRAQACIERANQEAAERARASDQLHGLFTNQTAAMEMRVFDAGHALDDRANRLWKEVAHTKFTGALKGAALSSAGWAILALGYVGALTLVAVNAAAGTASPGDVLLVAQLALQLRGNIAQTTTSVRQVVAAMRLTDRFLWLNDLADHQAAAFAGSVPCPEQIERGITLNHIGFTYPGTTTPVLRDVDVDLPAGATVAIVGENGAGKTTLVKLLCRFYDPTTGHITVDGVALSDLDAAEWQARLAGSFQDYLRLEATARHTIGVGDPPRMDDDRHVTAALERADSSQMPTQWPNGLNTHLGRTYEEGIELSGGQWQRLAIARGMMRPAPRLLVLDEPSAALDPSAEQALYERYASAARRARADGGIVVLVSHRFSSVRMADLIVVLDHGTVTEVGTHLELLARDGQYARMFRQQAAAYS